MQKFEQPDRDKLSMDDRANMLLADIKALQASNTGDFVVRLAKMRKALDEAAMLIEQYAKNDKGSNYDALMALAVANIERDWARLKTLKLSPDGQQRHKVLDQKLQNLKDCRDELYKQWVDAYCKMSPYESDLYAKLIYATEEVKRYEGSQNLTEENLKNAICDIKKIGEDLGKAITAKPTKVMAFHDDLEAARHFFGLEGDDKP